jgi:hypothetical protein
MSSTTTGAPTGPRIRRIHFNALPETQRKRLVDAVEGRTEPRPIFQEGHGSGGAIFGWGFLAVLALGGLGLSLVADFGRVCSPVQAPWVALVDFGLAFTAVYGVIAAVRASWLGRNIPFRRGRYVFPMDVVVARDEWIEIIPFGLVTNVGGVHMHRNGVYTGTHVTFSFEGRSAETLLIYGKHVADQALQQLRQVGTALNRALDTKDVDWLVRNDLFAEMRGTEAWNDTAAQERNRKQPGSGLRAGEMPAALAWASIPALVVAVAILPVWGVRQWLSDADALSQLESRSDESAVHGCECYVYGGGWHAEHVRDVVLPAAAFRAATSEGTVAAMRDFVREHPQAPQVPEARAAIHTLFESSRAQFMAQAATSDPSMPAFMTALLQFLEANDSPPVMVRFDAPSSEDLGATDTALAAEVGRPVAPIAPWFTPERSESREETVTRVLQRGFAAVFPNDVMTLEHAGRRPESAPEGTLVDPTRAEIEVRYLVRPSGSVYESSTSERVFVGIFVDFFVQMRVPNSTQAFSFVLEVEPPEHFTVTTYGGAYGQDSELSDGAVYDEMARRAFDQLSSRMGLVFFRPDTAAYQSAVAESQRQRAGDADRGAGYGGGYGGGGYDDTY